MRVKSFHVLGGKAKETTIVARATFGVRNYTIAHSLLSPPTRLLD